jgi:hypothetical protein
MLIAMDTKTTRAEGVGRGEGWSYTTFRSSGATLADTQAFLLTPDRKLITLPLLSTGNRRAR